MPPLVFMATAWIIGLVAAHHWLVPVGVKPASLGLLSLIPVTAYLFWPKDRSMRLSSACALALFAGAFRYQAAIPDLDNPGLVAYYNGSGWVTMEGVVDDFPDVRGTWINLYLSSEWIEVGGQRHPVRGDVLVPAPRFPKYCYGDRLRVSGVLETPPEYEDFSYRGYLARRGVHSLIRFPRIEQIASGQGSPFWRAIYAIRDRSSALIARLLPEPAASLMQGILLGMQTGIPADLYEDFNATGTSHIIVISGTNITIVATLFSKAFSQILGKRPAYWFTIAGISAYVLLVGADAAVIRAGLMGGLFVTALFLGRQATAHVSLFASAVVLTMLNPLALWDVGFQLSFAATLGLLIFTPAIERLFGRGLARIVSAERAGQVLHVLSQVLIITLAAQVLTIPLVVYHFRRLSLVALLANCLILPAQLPIMVGGAATLIGLVPFLEPVARVIAWVPWLFLTYTTTVVRWMAAWPFASLQISHFKADWLMFYCVVCVCVVWLLRQQRGTTGQVPAWIRSRWSTKVILGAPLVAACLTWLAILQLPDGKLHVAFLDVGQGDAILVTTPQGQQILVDGGPSPVALAAALGKEMPFWDRSIDLLVMTHADADHIAGLAEALSRYRVNGWVDNGRRDNDTIYLTCLKILEEKKTPHYVVEAGTRLELGQGIMLDVLHPPPEPMGGADADANKDSLVMRLVWDQASFLLTGDVEAETEQLLLRSGQPVEADVLKVAHHGSSGSSTAEFLAAVHPAFAVVSVGVNNHFGHPAPAVLDRLARLGDSTVLRTDKQGTVEFVTDGKRLWVQTEH